MKIKVSKSDLETALKVAEIGIAGSGSDLSTHFLFRKVEGRVEILSFNQRICAQAPLKCEVEGEDGAAFTLEGKRLKMWLGGVGAVAISLEPVDGGDVAISSPRSTIEIPSLDPSKFPVWDKSFAEATSIATLPSERMASALNYAKNFISDKDTTRPEISQVEVIDGSLWSTDKKAVTLITLNDLAKSNLRVHGKDVGSITKFLGLKGTEDVEILEHDRTVFFRRTDGSLVGASRPLASFPKLNVAKDGDDETRWVVDTSEVLAGIQCLSAAADWENTRLKFSYDKDAQNVVLGVKGVSGKDAIHAIPCIESEGTDDLPDDGFWIDYKYIQDIIGHFPSDTMKFGINKRGKGGYVRFQHADDADEYLTVVVWRI